MQGSTGKETQHFARSIDKKPCAEERESTKIIAVSPTRGEPVVTSAEFGPKNHAQPMRNGHFRAPCQLENLASFSIRPPTHPRAHTHGHIQGPSVKETHDFLTKRPSGKESNNFLTKRVSGKEPNISLPKCRLVRKVTISLPNGCPAKDTIPFPPLTGICPHQIYTIYLGFLKILNF